MGDEQQLPLGNLSPARAWTMAEIDMLRSSGHLGAEALATMLGRSVSSVKAAANRLRISLRPKGSRKGLVLGQPRDEKWRNGGMATLREDVLSGDTDMGALERRIVEIAMGDTQRPVCPACCARPQDRKATGLCEVCHLKALAQAHRDDRARKEAQRELWRARQEASRNRRTTQPTLLDAEE